MDFISMKRILEDKYNSKKMKGKLGLADLKDDELETLLDFLSYIIVSSESSIDTLYNATDSFRFGYTIKQLGKEFDMLRIGKNFSINIELKSCSTESKQVEQLKKNNLYLKILNHPIYYFSYSASERRFIGIKEFTDDKMVDEDAIELLISCLTNQEVVNDISIYNQIFHPANYLVSPFNQTKKFLEKSYILTPHQQNIKMEMVRDNKRSYSIIGGPGTGKTLVMYDIFESVDTNKALIHCGKLNEGHYELKRQGFNIVPVKQYKEVLNSDLEYLFIDEAQRFYEDQLLEVLDFLENSHIPIVFAYDPKQIFEFNDRGDVNHNHINSYLERTQGKEFKLKNSIRTNDTILDAAKLIFNHSKKDYNKIENSDYNIKLQYFDNNPEVIQKQIKRLKEDNYKILGYTPSKHYYDVYEEIVKFQDFNPHDVIGQEFKKVCVFVNHGFRYHSTNDKYELRCNGSSYLHGIKMLKMNVSRAIDELRIIVIDNYCVYTEIAKLFKNL